MFHFLGTLTQQRQTYTLSGNYYNTFVKLIVLRTTMHNDLFFIVFKDLHDELPSQKCWLEVGLFPRVRAACAETCRLCDEGPGIWLRSLPHHAHVGEAELTHFWICIVALFQSK